MQEGVQSSGVQGGRGASRVQDSRVECTLAKKAEMGIDRQMGELKTSASRQKCEVLD